MPIVPNKWHCYSKNVKNGQRCCCCATAENVLLKLMIMMQTMKILLKSQREKSRKVDKMKILEKYKKWVKNQEHGKTNKKQEPPAKIRRLGMSALTRLNISQGP